MADNCMDCPHHTVIPDPDPDDWFCDDDEAVICKLAKNPRMNPASRYKAERQDRRCVTVACRPYNKRRECEVPAWCPKKTTPKEPHQ